MKHKIYEDGPYLTDEMLLNDRALALLDLIERNPGICLAEISRAWKRSGTATNQKYIDWMEVYGFVSRVWFPETPTASHPIHITDSGKMILKLMKEILGEVRKNAARLE